MEADGGSSARKPAVKVASFDLLRGMNRVRGDDDALPLTPVSKSTSGSSHRVSRSSTIATLNELDPSDAVFFDPHLFLLHFLYTTLFPLSLVVQGILRLMSRELSFEAKLSWGACFPYLCFWVYFICDTLTAHPHLENEVAVVAVLMVLISLDTSAACANPHLKRLFRLRDLWESIRGRFRVPRSMVYVKLELFTQCSSGSTKSFVLAVA